MRTACVVGVLLCASSAGADVLHATLKQPMFEVSHTVDVRIEDGVATMRVKRQFANPGKVADEAYLELDLPTGAAATGLRIRAKDRWYDGELMEAEKAAKLYHELTGMGAAQPKDPALLAWMWADKLSLQIFPVLPGQVSTVEYTLTVPTRYQGGRYWVSYPRVAPAGAADEEDRGLPLATPIVTVHPTWATALTPITIDGRRAAPDTAVVLTPPVRQTWEDAVGAEASGSYVASAIEIPASSHTTKAFTTAKVTVDIKHTYKSDVRVELLAPNGKHVTLVDRVGGGTNNIAQTFDVKLPEAMPGNGTWRLVVSDHVALDNGSIDHWSLQLGTEAAVAATDVPVFIPDAPESGNDAGLAAIAVTPPPINVWNGRLGKIVASDAHAFNRLEVDTAPQISALPKAASIVFVVDASYSVGDAGLASQLAIVRQYVAKLPDAAVSIVAYRRTAAAVWPDFVPASAFAQKLAAQPIPLGNGSSLDAGLTTAMQVLAKRTGPRRIIVMSDKLLRTTLKEATVIGALAKLPADVVVHAIIPHIDDDDRVELRRDDADALAPIATKHHGILVQLSGLPSDVATLPPVEKKLGIEILELVRPTRIEKLTVDGGFKLDEPILHEGDGIRLFASGKRAVDRVTLKGVMWSDPVTKQIPVGDAFSRSSAAFLFGEDEHQVLSREEQLKVAFYGRAVSPVTSYVAYEPGTRPSIIGIQRAGTIGHGSGTGSGYGAGGGRYTLKIDFARLVSTETCVKQFKPAAGWRVKLTVETTKDEVVDVAVVDGAGPFASCLAETVWALRLDRDRFYRERESFTFELK